jgi:hypothetical protein
MPIQVRWSDDRQQAIVYEFRAEWTWQEVDAANVTVDKMAQIAPHPISYILDLRHSSGMPANLFIYIRKLSRQIAINYNNLTVIVGANTFVRAISSIVNRVYLLPDGLPPLVHAETIPDAICLVAAYMHKDQPT